VRVFHVITRLIVGGAQENTVATVLGLQGWPGREVSLVSGPSRPGEATLEPAFAACPEKLTLLPSLVRPPHPWHDVRAWAELTRLFRRWRPALVHTHSGKAGVLGRLAAHRAGVRRIVHTIHGPSFGAFQGLAANLLFRAAERHAGKVTTRFVSVAHAMTRQYLAAGVGRPEQYTRILSGFRLQPFLTAGPDPVLRQQLGISQSDLVVGKVARLCPLKGHDDLLAIAPALVRECPRLKFLLVGDGPWRKRLEDRARALGLAGHTVFAGFVPPERIPAFFGIMDLVVHFSRREGLARSVSQALCAARPVVVCDCDGAGEVCRHGETGFLVPPGDLARYSSQVLRLIGDPDLRRRLGLAGQQWVRDQFAVEKMLDELLALYRELGL
jgi:glycosyltransferase involved in cell wall biosynthesis